MSLILNVHMLSFDHIPIYIFLSKLKIKYFKNFIFKANTLEMAIAHLNSYLEESRGWSSEPFTGYSASTSLKSLFLI